MEELLQELADAELGKQVMVTVGVTEAKNKQNITLRKVNHNSLVLRNRNSGDKCEDTII